MAKDQLLERFYTRKGSPNRVTIVSNRSHKGLLQLFGSQSSTRTSLPRTHTGQEGLFGSLPLETRVLTLPAHTLLREAHTAGASQPTR